MAHISKRKLDQKGVDELERYLSSIIRNTGAKTRTRIFEELLTSTEKIMLSKRIAVLFLLKKGFSPYKISELVKISPSTAERFERAIKLGKYAQTIDWVWKNSNEGSFDRFMESLVTMAFTGRTRSLKQMVDEMNR